MKKLSIIASVLFSISFLSNANARGFLFADPVNYGAGDACQSVFAVDLDGDGYNDLAVANQSSNNVSVLLNNGDGTFQAAVYYGAGSGPTSIFAVNLDSDNDNDIAVINYYSNNVSVLLNNGDGTFPAAVNYGGVFYPHSVFAGDGTFQAAVNYGTGGASHSVFAVDLDGDSDNDLAVANGSTNNVSVLLNNGNGTFPAAVNYGAGSSPYSLFAGDLDGDDDNDLVALNRGSSNVSVLLNNSDGTFPAAVNYDAGYLPNSVFVIDVDGDSYNDLAVAGGNANNVPVLRNNGNGTFQAAVNYGAGDLPQSVFAVDLDGDGDNDLAVANRNSDNVSILMNMSIYTSVLVENVTANRTKDGVKIAWIIEADEAISGMKLLRTCKSDGSSVALPRIGLLPPDASHYVDSGTKPGREYSYTLVVIRADGTEVRSLSVSVTMPAPALTLIQNHPNPFSETTTISFVLPAAAKGDVSVFDINGRLVKTLSNGSFPEGLNTFQWDGKDGAGNRVGSSVYFLRLNVGKTILTKKMTLAR
jgi:hypothetical protein